MSIIVDIVLAAVLLLTVINGYRRGFVKTAFGLLGVFVAFFVASGLSPQLGAVIDDAFARDAIEDVISSNLSEAFESGGAEMVGAKISEYAPTEEIGRKLTEICIEKGRESVESISADLAKSVSVPMCNAFAFIIIFIATYFLVRLAAVILDSFFRLPVLKGANRWMGLIVGIFSGTLILIVLSRSFNSMLPWLSQTYPHLFSADLAEKTVIFNFLR